MNRNRPTLPAGGRANAPEVRHRVLDSGASEFPRNGGQGRKQLAGAWVLLVRAVLSSRFQRWDSLGTLTTKTDPRRLIVLLHQPCFLLVPSSSPSHLNSPT